MKIFPTQEKKDWYTVDEVFGRIRYKQWWHQNTIGGKVAFFFLKFKYVSNFFRDFKFRMRMAYQTLVRGFSDSEVYNLSDHIARFVYPRLIMFRDCYSAVCPGVLLEEMFPGQTSLSEEQETLAYSRWIEILNTMIFSFGKMLDSQYNMSDEDQQRFDDGLALFAKYLNCLWD